MAMIRRQHILNMLTERPMTAVDITERMKQNRFDDYSFWAVGQITPDLVCLKSRSEIEVVGYSKHPRGNRQPIPVYKAVMSNRNGAPNA